MKFTLAASALALASSVSAVELYAKSDNSAVDGLGASSIHEGAAINYFFFGSEGEDLTYSESDKSLSAPIGSFDAYVQIWSNIVELTPGEGVDKFTFSDDGALQLNGSSSGFYAQKNTNDPYSYSKNEYQLVYYASDAPSDAVAVTLFSKGAESATSTSSAASSTAVANSTTPAVTTFDSGAAGSVAVGSVAAVAAAGFALLF